MWNSMLFTLALLLGSFSLSGVSGQYGGQYGGAQYGNQYGAQYGNQYGNRYSGQYGNRYSGQYGNQYGGQYGNQYGGQYGSQYSGQDNQHGGQYNSYSENDYKSSSTKEKTKVEFCVSDSAGQPVEHAIIYYTQSSGLGVVSTNSKGIAKATIAEDVSNVIVSRHGFDPREKELQLGWAGGNKKLEISLNRPANFKIFVQDPVTCKTLEDVFVEYSSGNVTNSGVSDSCGVVAARVQDEDWLTAKAYLPGYLTGQLKVNVDTQVATRATLSLPPKFQVYELVKAVLNWNSASCMSTVDLMMIVVRGGISQSPVPPQICSNKNNGLNSVMETLKEVQATDTIIVTVKFEFSSTACAAESQARIALYDYYGNSKTANLPSFQPSYRHDVTWVAGCFYGANIKSFSPVGKIVKFQDVNVDLCNNYKSSGQKYGSY